jgi:hypothetical protein
MRETHDGAHKLSLLGHMAGGRGKCRGRSEIKLTSASLFLGSVPKTPLPLHPLSDNIPGLK